MKKITAFLLAFALIITLAGCFNNTENTETTVESVDNTGNFEFTKENFPELIGSLALLPLGEAVLSTALGITREEAKKMIGDKYEGSTTDKYEKLIDGKTNIILAYEPSADALKYAEEKGFEWEMTTIGADALVFICSNLNNVSSLTTEQVKDIYRGKTTDWSEVGGEKGEIIPYQRNKESGSQTLFDKLINLGEELMEPLNTSQIVDSMFGLLEAISDYDNSEYSLGYTVYYYLTNMESEKLKNSKILSIDDVEPTPDTIASGEYPFVNDFYVVIPKGLSDDDPAKILYNWLISEQGKELIAKENYVAK